MQLREGVACSACGTPIIETIATIAYAVDFSQTPPTLLYLFPFHSITLSPRRCLAEDKKNPTQCADQFSSKFLKGIVANSLTTRSNAAFLKNCILTGDIKEMMTLLRQFSSNWNWSKKAEEAEVTILGIYDKHNKKALANPVNQRKSVQQTKIKVNSKQFITEFKEQLSNGKPAYLVLKISPNLCLPNSKYISLVIAEHRKNTYHYFPKELLQYKYIHDVNFVELAYSLKAHKKRKIGNVAKMISKILDNGGFAENLPKVIKTIEDGQIDPASNLNKIKKDISALLKAKPSSTTKLRI